jgi:beta-lactamase superfamily II metal-dependent hydrolase
MAPRTIVMILFVGQGMATLVEGYNDGNTSTTPDYLVLVDFGGNQAHADNAAEYVANKLLAQKKAGATPTFDLVVISHQDRDHLSLLPNLRAYIEKKGITFSIGEVYLGGARWSKANTATVAGFVDDGGMDIDDAEVAAPAETDYHDPSDLGHLLQFNNVSVRVLIAGYVPPDEKRADIIKNASSAVIVIDNGSTAVVLPGDATYHTMGEINDMMAKKKWKTAKPPPLSKVTAIEVPHHGALRTAVEDYTAKGKVDDFDFSIINKFASNMAPQAVIASAGPRNSHNHPLREVIEVFEGKLATVKSHSYVAYQFSKKKASKVEGWDQFPTTDAIFTTIVTLDKKGNYTWSNQSATLTGTKAGMMIELAEPAAQSDPAAEPAADAALR